MTLPPVSPLILTAAFDADAGAMLQRMRDQHFPAALNIVPAHLTLFHHLPGAELPAIDRHLRQACAAQEAVPFTGDGLRFLGRGVAIAIAASALVALRGTLARDWQSWLGAQDRQGFRPHVTVQNKVDPGLARQLRDQLAAAPPPVEGTIVGLDLWHYRGGPWERAGRYAFRSAP